MYKTKPKKYGFSYLTSSILLLLLAFLMAVTATLAWFSMNISSRVSGILFEVTTKDNLLIAVRQWRFRQIEAVREDVQRIEATYDSTSESFVYIYNSTRRTANKENIYNLNDKQYVFVSARGEELDRAFTVSDELGLCAFYAGESAINASLYSDRSIVEQGYLLSGYILEEPEEEDYTNEITEAQLAKICMNDKDATAITDALTASSTKKGAEGFATSLTELVGLDGKEHLPNWLASGGRFTTATLGMQDTTAYKYEFDLYFMSESDFGLVLNTLSSSVRSEPNNSATSYDVEAWRKITIDEHTTDVNLKNYYGSAYGSRETILEGTKIFAQAKNAIRVGFSSSNLEPIAIWDPHASFGWSKNEPESNLALEYYNYVTGKSLVGSPANATLTSQTYLINSMEKSQSGMFKASIKVTIWLEGFDGDCFDSLMNESLKFRLDFAGQSPR